MNEFRRFVVAVLLVVAASSATMGAPAQARPHPTRPPIGFSPGDTAPDLTLVTGAGKKVRLSSLRGGYVVLDLSTLWCPPSTLVATEVRDTVSALNAPGALGAPFTWLTAEVEGHTPGVAPTSTELVDFAVRWSIGDGRSPLVGFGRAGSAERETARAQARAYGDANGGPGGAYPTLVLLDPRGTILDVSVGFVPRGAQAPGVSDTVSRFTAAMGATDVPYELRPAPYAAVRFDSAEIGLTVDAVRARGPLTADATPIEPGSAYIAQAYGGSAVLDIELSTVAEDGTPSVMAPGSTYAITLRHVAWAPLAPYRNLRLTPGAGSVDLVTVRNGEPAYTPTGLTVGANGRVGPFRLDRLAAYGALPAGEDVVGLSVLTTWDGPLVPSFGMPARTDE